jgi:hypothetical protein
MLYLDRASRQRCAVVRGVESQERWVGRLLGAKSFDDRWCRVVAKGLHDGGGVRVGVASSVDEPQSQRPQSRSGNLE